MARSARARSGPPSPDPPARRRRTTVRSSDTTLPDPRPPSDPRLHACRAVAPPPSRRAGPRPCPGVVAAGAALAAGELISALHRRRRPVAADRRRHGGHRLRAARLQGARGRAVRDERQDRAQRHGRRSRCSRSARSIGLVARRSSTLAAAADRRRWSGVGRARRAPRPARPALAYVALSAGAQLVAGIAVLRAADERRAAAPGHRRPGRRRRPPRVPRQGRRAGRCCRSSATASAGPCSTRAPPQVASADVAVPATVDPAPSLDPDNAFTDLDGLTPLVIAQRRLLPDRHRAAHAGRRRRARGPCASTAWSTARSTLTFDQLVELPLIERYVTIACVSNEVGGDLIGNAKWTGVLLTDVLEMAGVQAGRDPDRAALRRRLGGRLPDRVGHGPRAAARRADRREDERRAAAGGARVPGPAHRPGPVRLRVGDQVADRDRADDLGGVRLLLGAPRLVQGGPDPHPVPDRPAQGQHRLERRPDVQVAGVAWAMDRGVSKVEVRVDDGPWEPATLATPIGPQTWVQWRHAWTSAPGRHAFAVRATDGAGVVQEDRVTPPGPRRRPRLPLDPDQRRLSRGSGTLGADASTPLPLRDPRPVRRRHGGRPGQPDLLPPGPRRDADRVRRPREGPGRGPRAAPGRPARGAGAARDRGRRGPAGPVGDTAALDEPINEAFRVGVLSIGWDTADELIVLEARELTEADEDGRGGEDEDEDFADDDDEDGPDLLRVRLTPASRPRRSSPAPCASSPPAGRRAPCAASRSIPRGTSARVATATC